MHAEKREGQGRQNNGGAFPASQANSESSLNIFQKLLSFFLVLKVVETLRR